MKKKAKFMPKTEQELEVEDAHFENLLLALFGARAIHKEGLVNDQSMFEKLDEFLDFMKTMLDDNDRL